MFQYMMIWIKPLIMFLITKTMSSYQKKNTRTKTMSKQNGLP